MHGTEKRKRGRALMNITGTYANPKPVEAGRTYSPRQYGAAQARRGDWTRRFDSVSIGSERGSYALEVRGKIERDVRTATSSGFVASLREQVQSGRYAPDAGEIARKLLLLEGGE